ncbi:MAG: indolepyruvate oxidoreductase subunit beta family protein [Propionibacteriaceae bacterium]|nr:indolepyruvate oxidoreductase subunit beta family protein [Propionibacteriaceae bacterium]
MGSWKQGRRPITIAILAMGGEGGGVLSTWIADTAERSGYVAQATQVAGVAQRTGTTVYYVELYPQDADDAVVEGRVRNEPVLSMFPIPGQCDIVVASELMEAGRAVQRGFVTPDRTTFICSTNRVYSIDEKSAVGDGRVDSEQLLASVRVAARRFVGADFMQMAVAERSVISSALFGALAGSAALPFERSIFEESIQAAGKGVKKSLAAFARGFDMAADAVRAEQAPARERVMLTLTRREPSPEDLREVELTRQASDDPCSLIGPKLQTQGRRIAQGFPAASRLMLVRGCLRTALYQDEKYATRYLDRIERLLAVESDPDGAALLTTEAARYTALLMTYQDTIHVALQKIRAARLADIRVESRAKNDQLVDVYEYLHPDVSEVTDTMPAAVGKALRANKLFAAAVKGARGGGIVINTTSVVGFTTLTTLANLRPMRPTTLRFKRVQKEVDAWLALVTEMARSDYALGVEVTKAAHVIKGYGETFEHGMESFEKLLAAARRMKGRQDASERLAELRRVALSDEGGESLELALTTVTGPGVDGASVPSAP